VSRQGDAGWPGPKPGGADQTVSGRFAARKLEVQCLHGLARFEALTGPLTPADARECAQLLECYVQFRIALDSADRKMGR
jgi:hypothetical protein